MATEGPSPTDLEITNPKAGSKPNSRVNSRAGSASSNTRHANPSPRATHFDGDVPPSLSPLDALAAHSRKLAKELEETRLAGERRLSRLPPQVIRASMSDRERSKPKVFRALSDGSEHVPTLHQLSNDSLGTNPRIREPQTRPVSFYPRISAVFNPEERPESQYFTPRQSYVEELRRTSTLSDLFEVPRSESPHPIEQNQGSPQLSSRPTSGLSVSELLEPLAPPNAAFARSKGHHESSDDDYTSSNGGSTFSRARRLSSSSGLSVPQSPASTKVLNHDRAPSNISVTSFNENKARSSHLNFSRPMSTAGLSGYINDGPTRKASKASQASKASKTSYTSSNPPALPITSFDEVRSDTSEGFVARPASSYTHATYNLPRGRMADRTSAVFLGLSTPHFEWQEPMFPGTPNSESCELPFGTPGDTTPATQDGERMHVATGFAFDFSSPKPEEEKEDEVNLETSDPSEIHALSEPDQSMQQPYPLRPVALPVPVDGVSRSDASTSTVRPPVAKMPDNYQALTPDEHVSKAIELHQHGDLKESTYHLRVAAKYDHATGMLLYALACRHGWGMRANQAEGVKWLRKAVDSAMLDIADDENPNSDKPKADYHEKKTHRAQFALSIYELGVSHLNGWGIEQDKALALRCFEIAGNWGDTDALTEAGFCYAEGIGCKKDMRKAAKFYRMAEARGVSMIGNSWIHKEKYNDDDDKNNNDEVNNKRRSRFLKKSSTEKLRSRSKTRSIFARKKTPTN